MAYVQHRFGLAIHIVREVRSSGKAITMCGKWYLPSSAFTPDLGGEREENVVCSECRWKAAAAVGKRVYSRPTLRRGLSEAKRYKLHKKIKAHQERQRLAAWNSAAQKETT